MRAEVNEIGKGKGVGSKGTQQWWKVAKALI